MNLCYIFSCERRPPSEEEMKGLKDQAKKQNEKLKKMNKKEETIINKEDEILQNQENLIPSPKLQRKDSMLISEITGGGATKDNDKTNTQESSYP